MDYVYLLPSELRAYRHARTAWEHFHNNITQYELYRPNATSTWPWHVRQLVKDLASLPVSRVEEMAKKGTQIKLILTLSDRTVTLFKPMRLVPAVPD